MKECEQSAVHRDRMRHECCEHLERLRIAAKELLESKTSKQTASNMKRLKEAVDGAADHESIKR